MQHPAVVREQSGPLAIVRLNRPEALNAVTFEMIDAFRHLVREAEADPSVTAIAVTGEGRGFCSGFDAASLATIAADPSQDRDMTRPGEAPALFSFLLAVRKPLIAAINGPAAAGGVVLAMMCDLRFASESASFSTVFAKRGLIAEHGMSWLLPRLVGASRALDLLWSSRKVDAQEALRIGLVDRVVPQADLLTAAADYAAGLADSVAPRAIAAIKEQVYGDLSRDFMNAACVAHELKLRFIAHPDVAEGAAAFLEKRKPRFTPLSG
jgi:enoyl-CoA hydratase/carnithine racemase